MSVAEEIEKQGSDFLTDEIIANARGEEQPRWSARIEEGDMVFTCAVCGTTETVPGKMWRSWVYERFLSERNGQ